MIVRWMLYGTLVALIIAGAALAAERVCAARAWPRRWVWLVAMAGSILLPLLALVRPASSPVAGAAATATAAAPSVAAARTLVVPPTWLERAMRGARERSAAVETWHVPVLVGWALTTAFLLGTFVAGIRVLAARRRDWRDDVVDGERVLLATDTGPAVVGALRPRIVLPAWALGLPRDARALMLAHEREHLRARDPLLLHVAALVAALLPWNAGAWWIVRRLRLAVELDCDARVLRATRDAHAYGALLVTVGSRRMGAPLPLAAPALLERPSSLERRITAMLPVRSRFPRVTVAVAAITALGAIVVACEMPSPEMLAPDGQELAATRVYGLVAPGNQEVEVVRDLSSLQALITSRHPEVAQGAGPSIVYLVRDERGQVVMSERQDANFAKMRSPSGDSAVSGELRARQREGVELEERASLRMMADTLVVRPSTRQAQGAGLMTRSKASAPSSPSAVPAGIGAIRPDEIASVEVSKYGAGRIGPDPVSVILIALKPGARVPTRSSAP